MPADFPIEILIGIRQESFENSIKILVPSAFLTKQIVIRILQAFLPEKWMAVNALKNSNQDLVQSDF